LTWPGHSLPHLGNISFLTCPKMIRLIGTFLTHLGSFLHYDRQLRPNIVINFPARCCLRTRSRTSVPCEILKRTYDGLSQITLIKYLSKSYTFVSTISLFNVTHKHCYFAAPLSFPNDLNFRPKRLAFIRTNLNLKSTQSFGPRLEIWV